MPKRNAGAALLGALCLALPATAAAVEIDDPGQGPVSVETRGTGAAHLSGLTRAGGSRYFAVSDNIPRLFPMRIEVDPETGRVSSVALEKPVRLAAARDVEGVAYTGRGTVLASDEHGPAIREHRVTDGAVVAEVAVPEIYRRARLNLSLESLALRGDGVLWTANEEALAVDGAPASARAGSLVRLQRFAADGTPAGQWAYRTDPFPGRPLAGFEGSGVVDLLALPGDSLLVLERSFSNRGFRIRIYEVTPGDATDTSSLPSLETEGLRAVAKRRRWERGGLSYNFEGIALGPRLASGADSLLLVSDDGGLTDPQLYALRIRGLPPDGVPGPGAGAASASEAAGSDAGGVK